MADVKNFGLKGISNDVQLGKGGGRFKWSSANDRYEFTGSDGSMSMTKAIRMSERRLRSVNGSRIGTGRASSAGASPSTSSSKLAL